MTPPTTPATTDAPATEPQTWQFAVIDLASVFAGEWPDAIDIRQGDQTRTYRLVPL